MPECLGGWLPLGVPQLRVVSSSGPNLPAGHAPPLTPAVPGRPHSAQMEDFPAPRYAWVPYYVMHKILAGLVDYHRLWQSSRALAIAVRARRP